MTPRVTPLSVGLLRQKGSNSALYEMSQKSAIVPMPESSNKKTTELKIGFFDISGYSPTMQFILLTAAVFVFYLVYGYMQVSYKYYNNIPFDDVPIFMIIVLDGFCHIFLFYMIKFRRLA